MRTLIAVFLLVVLPLFASADSHNFQRMASGLDEPWALAFLPNGQFLITERGGKLLLFDAAGKSRAVRQVPRVYVNGQGGLLDVVVSANFAANGLIYLSYAKKLSGGRAGTAVTRARLDVANARLRDVAEIFVMDTPSSGGRHFGSRIVEARDGSLFVTLGERGDRPLAQDNSTHNGTVIRITQKGAPHPANPNLGGLPEIWSYGHRNAQGAALDRNGQLYVVEHGARGGDEVNRVRKGANYGWPVISYGRHYSGLKIGEGQVKAGMEQPQFYWDPSIAPSGLAIYSGKANAAWAGDFLVGSLKFDMISRLKQKGGKMVEVERIAAPQTERVRDIREAPDGSIWFLSVGQGAAYRFMP